MNVIELGNGNKVDETIDFMDFSMLVHTFNPKKVYQQTIDKKLLHENNHSDSIKVILEHGKQLTMNFSEYVYFPHESKELMILETEDQELAIFYSVNSDEVFGQLTTKCQKMYA